MSGDARQSYWEECISVAFEECGLTATAGQIREVAWAVQGAHESYGMAFYSPPAGEHLRDELRATKAALKAECEKVHCRKCGGTGSITTPGPYHSSTSQCWKCNGDGRHAP